jgi:GT2 family glycosyltransferase
MNASTMTPPDALQVSIVLGSFNRKWYLQQTVACLRRELKAVGGEIIIVEGGSTDGSVEWLAKQKDVVLILQHNKGDWQGEPLERRSWGGFMNLGFKCARGKYILMVSDDVILERGALTNSIREFESALAAGQKLGALAFPWLEWPTLPKLWVRKVCGRVYVNHGLFLRTALEQVGWIDEGFQFYFADFDLCLRLTQAGYRIDIARDARALHNYHANTFLRKDNMDRAQGDKQYLLDKWQHVLRDVRPAQLNEWEFQTGCLTAETLQVFERRWRDPAFVRYALATYGRAWLREWTGHWQGSPKP